MEANLRPEKGAGQIMPVFVHRKHSISLVRQNLLYDDGKTRFIPETSPIWSFSQDNIAVIYPFRKRFKCCNTKNFADTFVYKYSNWHQRTYEVKYTLRLPLDAKAYARFGRGGKWRIGYKAG
jgi:hypothetical protein